LQPFNPSAPFPDEEGSTLATPERQKVGRKRRPRKLIVLSGPTATGKSRMAIELAQHLGGEIISADSVQVYRGMDVGTAKVTYDERLAAPHHLIDICDLSEPFNVSKYYDMATQTIDAIFDRGGVPIVVGGTGFYIHALIYGPPMGPPSVPEVRKELEEQMEKFGHEALYDHLQKCDPLYAKTITPGDRNKIIRALEIIKLSKRPVSDFKLVSPSHSEKNYDFHCSFIHYPRETTYQRIEMRCDEMVAGGLIDEVKRLMKEGLEENSSAAQAIGYRQVLDFIHSGEADFAGFVAAFKQASRRYAKRQFTWFRREPLFTWFDLEDLGYEAVIQQIIDEFESSL